MGKTKVTTFAEHLRILREDAQLSLREVAEKTGIDASLIGRIERSDRPPTKEQIRLFAKCFKSSEADMLKQFLSDQIAYKMLEEEADISVLKVAEEKVKYLKTTNHGK